jgi:hypothetical protein
VNGARWLRSQIERIVAAESAVSFEELAKRTQVSYAEVQAAVWPLYGAKRVDICHGYVVAPPRAAERRLTA